MTAAIAARRPVLIDEGTVKMLRSTAAYLEKKGFKDNVARIRELADSYESMEGFIAVQETALTLEVAKTGRRAKRPARRKAASK